MFLNHTVSECNVDSTYVFGLCSCFFPEQNKYVVFIGEISIVSLLWLIGVITLILVGRVFLQPYSVDKPLAGDPRLTLGQVRASGIILGLAGVTWVIGILALRLRIIALEYTFCFCNITLGFLIFLFRCILDPEARSSWNQFCLEGTCKQTRGSTATPESDPSPERSSRFGDVFATNPIITSTQNTWNKHIESTEGTSQALSMKYGRPNVNFADVLEHERSHQPPTPTHTARRAGLTTGDNHITEL